MNEGSTVAALWWEIGIRPSRRVSTTPAPCGTTRGRCRSAGARLVAGPAVAQALGAVEQADLRHGRAPGRSGQAEVAVGAQHQDAPARRAADEALLQQVRLDDLLQRVARLRQGGRDGLDAHRPAVVVL